MDPSCTLGFYCRDLVDFEMFCAQVSKRLLVFRIFLTIKRKEKK